MVLIARPLLIAVHAGLILYGAAIHATTMDEPSHLASGVLNLRTGNYEPYRVNPPLYRQLAAIPVLLGEYEPLPDGFAEVVLPGARSEWQAGYKFAELNSTRYRSVLVRGRLAGAAWSCLGLWLVFAWGRALAGVPAGLIAAMAWCFEPNIVAHAQHVGPDVPAAVGALLAMWVLRAYLGRPTAARAAAAGTGLAVALLTKFSCLLVLPVWLPVFLLAGGPDGHRRPWSRRGGHLAVAGAVVWLLVSAGYEFTKMDKRLGDLTFVSDFLSGHREEPGGAPPLGNRFRDSALGGAWLPIPADYVLGIDAQARDFERGRRSTSSYLGGEMKAGGWWYYYLYGLGVKVPLGFLALMLCGLGLGILKPVSAQRREVLLLLGPALLIVVGVSSQTGFNHHVRYVLPALPFLIVAAGWFGAAVWQRGWGGRVAVAVLVLWGVGSHVRYYPHSLSYFNEIAGGPRNGHAHLIDSNIDWGQDLTLLKEWEDDHPEARPMQYALFTSLPTEQWGLSGGPAVSDDFATTDVAVLPLRGWYAVSVTLLRGRPVARVTLPEEARRYFLMTPPTDRVGYSILIFYVPPD